MLLLMLLRSSLECRSLLLLLVCLFLLLVPLSRVGFMHWRGHRGRCTSGCSAGSPGESFNWLDSSPTASRRGQRRATTCEQTK